MAPRKLPAIFGLGGFILIYFPQGDGKNKPNALTKSYQGRIACKV